MSHYPVAEIRSVDLVVPDMAAAEVFYTTVWGLTIVDRADGTTFLRATGPDHHVLALHEGAAIEILSITFRTSSLAELDEIAHAAVEHGGVLVAAPAPNQAPDGGTVLTVRSPEGFLLRFVHGDRLHPPMDREDFVPTRLSHVNLNCADIDATRLFFQRALGFDLTDRSKMMAFLRCNSDHHAVVLADSGVDGLNHVAFMMADCEAVMRGSGRMVDHGYPIGWGVGRHGPGNNIFAYFVDPFGYVIEYTTDVLQVDDDYAVGGPQDWVWPPGRTDLWGIAPPKSDHVKHRQLAVTFASPGNSVSPPSSSTEVTERKSEHAHS